MDLIKDGAPRFGIAAVGSEKIDSFQPAMDKSPYLSGVKTFTGMFKTRVEPIRTT